MAGPPAYQLTISIAMQGLAQLRAALHTAACRGATSSGAEAAWQTLRRASLVTLLRSEAWGQVGATWALPASGAWPWLIGSVRRFPPAGGEPKLSAGMAAAGPTLQRSASSEVGRALRRAAPALPFGARPGHARLLLLPGAMLQLPRDGRGLLPQDSGHHPGRLARAAGGAGRGATGAGSCVARSTSPWPLLSSTCLLLLHTHQLHQPATAAVLC